MNIYISTEYEHIYKNISKTMPNNPILYGYKIYSQCDEDGIISHILKNISNITSMSHSFIEFGSSNGLENNTHALLLQGYHGSWIEGSKEKINQINCELGGLSLSPLLQIIESRVTLENIDDISAHCLKFLQTKDIDFLSMDLDGNDYFFMKKLISKFNAKLICVEYNGKFPPPIRIVMDYNPNHSWSGDDYYGSSLQSWVDLLSKYTLICCNITGVNAFFVREDLCSQFPLYPINMLYQPPRYAFADFSSGHQPSLKWLRQILNT